MASQWRKFLVIENESFDVVVEGRKMDGIRISEKGGGASAFQYT